MTEQTVPRCTCGGGAEPEGGTKRIIFAGASKAGQLSNEAAVWLTKEGYGNIACTASLAVSTPSIKKKVEEADEVVVIDGCPVGCARQIVERAGIAPDQEIVVTALGIEKGGSLDLSEEDVETVVSAAWEGRGRGEQRKRTSAGRPVDAAAAAGGRRTSSSLNGGISEETSSTPASGAARRERP